VLQTNSRKSQELKYDNAYSRDIILHNAFTPAKHHRAASSLILETSIVEELA
jgi:hypothetical protein